MREIKFRAWDKIDNEMRYVDKIGWEGRDTYVVMLDDSRYYVPGEAEIMQYTGLLDKHNKEIWEGDVVMFLTTPPGAGGKTTKCYGEVWYRPEECGYSVKSPQFMYSSGRPMIIGLCPRPEYYEVVGNIYEHKELLEAMSSSTPVKPESK